MKSALFSNTFLKWIALFGSVLILLFYVFINEVPQDEGDGLQHFSIAQESWNNNELFLNHWGKPLFTLLASPFAQGGFISYLFFNVLVFIGTIVLVFKIFRFFDVANGYSIIVPFLLLTIPDYTAGIVAGLTEPFFGFLLVLLVYFVLKERWILFALVVSFIPFARSEGMLVVVIAACVLVVVKQWKLLPLLFFGFLVYALLGTLILDQPWWYFENDPYPASSIYGKGSWFAYYSSRNYHLGILPIILLPIGFFGWFIWKSKQRNTVLKLTCIVLGVYLGVIIMHSYLWASGLKGSLGLSRIATHGLPAFICLLLISCHFVTKELNSSVNKLLFIAFSVLMIKEIDDLPFPNRASNFHKLVFKASDYLKHQDLSGRKVYYLHPLLPYDWGLNTFQNHSVLTQRFIHLTHDLNTVFKPGDLLFRDSHFGPLEQGLSIDSLQKFPWIVPIKQFYPDSPAKEFNGDQQCVIIYQIMNPEKFDARAERATFEDQTFSFPQKVKSPKIESSNEFENISDQFKIPDASQGSVKLKMTISLKKADEQPVFLIFDDGKGTYCSASISGSKQTIEWPFTNKSTAGILFVHNPSRIKYSLQITDLSWKKRKDSGLLPR